MDHLVQNFQLDRVEIRLGRLRILIISMELTAICFKLLRYSRRSCLKASKLTSSDSTVNEAEVITQAPRRKTQSAPTEHTIVLKIQSKLLLRTMPPKRR